MPDTLSDSFNRAVALYRAGHLDEAEALCSAIVRAQAEDFHAFHLLAVVQLQLGRLHEALTSFDKALAIKPDYAEALIDRGATLHNLQRFEEALASVDKALAVKPDHPEALYDRGITLQHLTRFEEALASFAMTRRWRSNRTMPRP